MILKALKAISISFPRNLKIKYLAVIIFNIISGFIEVLSVSLVIPFTSVIIKRESILEIDFLNFIYNFFNFTDLNSFIIFFSLFFLSVIIISNLISIVNVWIISYLTYNLDYNLLLNLYKNYLKLEFKEKLLTNSSDLIAKMTIQVKRFVEGVVNSLMTMIQKIITIFLIVIFLSILNFKITFFTILILILTYLLFYKSINKIIYNRGYEVTQIFNKRQKIISETIFGIKEIKLYNLDSSLVNNLKKLSLRLAKNVAFMKTVAVVPRYLLEIILFIVLIPLLIILFANQNNDFVNILPLLSAFIFGIYKLSPAIQSIFASVVNIRSDLTAFDSFKKDIENKSDVGRFEKNSFNINFKNNLRFKKVSFTFDKNKNALHEINIKIEKGKTIGLIGESGSGKTTLLNLILGFFKPSSGEIFVDDYKIDLLDNTDWMSKIGYVSQFTFLFDDTLSNDITMFDKNVREDFLEECIKNAGLNEFYNKNNKNLNLRIGERGSKISGGEIQRIGLARALYRKPKILILDEFTSSLDKKIEQEILNNIFEIKDNLTIILSTHKYSVLQICDYLYEIDKGHIKFEGKINDFKTSLK